MSIPKVKIAVLKNLLIFGEHASSLCGASLRGSKAPRVAFGWLFSSVCFQMSPQIASLQECWLLFHIFLGQHGRWLIDLVEEEHINSKELLGGGQSFWTRNKNLLQWMIDNPENKTCDKKALKCDQCDSNLKYENGLKIHVGKSHKKVKSTPAAPDCLKHQLRS